MKDNFSIGSDRYARYRPTYPDALYDFILANVTGRQHAWDCGTGNGQVAHRLSDHFQHVMATDISSSQLAQAIPHERITYSMQRAEATDFPDDFFDLIIVAQAIHWFDFDRFYAEVNRTLRQDGLMVAVGYGPPVITPEVDAVISDFYFNTVGPYWDKERTYIDEHYRTIPFPFQELAAPQINNISQWEFDRLIGYLETWSAVKHYQRENGQDPMPPLIPKLKAAWGDAPLRSVNSPVFMRAGRKKVS